MGCFLKNIFFTKCKKINIKASFSLIELTIVLFVAGIIISGGLMSYKASNPKMRSDLKKIQAIEEALQQFFTTNGRLPYPAYPFKDDNENYLLEYSSDAYNSSNQMYYCSAEQKGESETAFRVCNSGDVSSCCANDFILWGVVPTRTLGLPDSFAYDSHGHNFEYITHSALTYLNGKKFTTGHEKSSYVTNQNGKYVVYFTHQKEDPIGMPIERLNVYDNLTNTEIVTAKDNTAYVIISKGQSDKCYFDTKTGNVETTRPNDNTINNCVANYNNIKTYRNIYIGYSKDFDNIVKYKTLSELIQKNSNIKEDTRILTNRNSAVEYQLKVDDRLVTESKEVTGSINEISNSINKINSMFKVVSTFEGVIGDSLTLYFLTTAYDNYDVGIYIYQDEKFIPLNNAKKSVCETMYPVGSIYITSNSDLNTNDKVNKKLGCGEWQRVECGAILQNAGSGGYSCGGAMASDYWAKTFSDNLYYYRDIPVKTLFKAGLPSVSGGLGCIFGSPCHDRSSCAGFNNGAFVGHKYCGHTSMGGSGSGMETYEIDFDASRNSDIYGSARTVQPFTYTVYMWERIS